MDSVTLARASFSVRAGLCGAIAGAPALARAKASASTVVKRAAPLRVQARVSLQESLAVELARKSLDDLIQFDCRQCHGARRVPCGCCDGRGHLAKGGYNLKNPVNIARIVGSKWTAEEKTFGWRHFRVASMRKHGKAVFVEMVATCDESTKFHINAVNLKDRSQWSMGWKQKSEMSEPSLGPECKACKGAAMLDCPLCAQASAVFEL